MDSNPHVGEANPHVGEDIRIPTCMLERSQGSRFACRPSRLGGPTWSQTIVKFYPEGFPEAKQEGLRGETSKSDKESLLELVFSLLFCWQLVKLRSLAQALVPGAVCFRVPMF